MFRLQDPQQFTST